jgi:Zn-dependent peptidase ImmA (M78 family)
LFICSAEKQRSVERLEEIESLAKDIRKYLNIGLSPIENLTELLEDNGVKVISWSGEERDFDGFSCWVNRHVPLIVIKAGLPGDRQRSNLAHELGHLVLKPGKAIDPEKAALRFSGAFLVPDEIVYRELGATRHNLDLPELLSLKQKYGMSIQQWIYRAKDLGIITNGYAANLFRFIRARGFHIKEPGEPLPEETSSRLRRLALQAVAEEIVSPARAAELTGIPIVELRAGIQS